MRTFTNANARNLQEAVALAQEAHREGQAVSFAGGGTDLLQLVKNKTVNRPGSGVPAAADQDAVRNHAYW